MNDATTKEYGDFILITGHDLPEDLIEEQIKSANDLAIMTAKANGHPLKETRITITIEETRQWHSPVTIITFVLVWTKGETK